MGLAFPEVIIARGGFDVVLGNPPWERIKLQEQEFFAGHPVADEPNAAARTLAIGKLAEAAEGTPDRSLYQAFQIAKRVSEASGIFARVQKGVGGRFPLTGRGDLNTFGLFTELGVQITRNNGRSGLVLPSGILTDVLMSSLLRHLISTNKLRLALTFSNCSSYFPGTTTEMFTLLTLGYGDEEAKISSFLAHPEQADDIKICLSLNDLEIDRINPNTGTMPLFRSRQDGLISAKIYQNSRAFCIENEKSPSNPWGVKFPGFYHMANDSHLFYDAKKIGSNPVYQNSESLIAVSADGRQWLPLYEGKMMHQFDHRFGDFAGLSQRPGKGGTISNPDFISKKNSDLEVNPWYWIEHAEYCSRKKQIDWQSDWIIVWRFGTKPTNERTLISTALPNCATPHVLSAIIADFSGEKKLSAALLSNVNSILVDFVCRTKMSRQGLDAFILKQLPILPPNAYSKGALDFIVPRVLELTYTSHSMAPFARDLGYEGPPFTWDEDRRAQLRAELDAWYALAYGLARDELRYVLDPKDVMGPDYPSETFRVLQNNEIRKYGEYRTRRLVLAAYDALVAEGMRPRTEGYHT